MKKAEQDFWRLFGDYECLTRDQTASIMAGDFAAVGALSEKKAVILPGLVRLASVLKIHRNSLELEGRLVPLFAAERRNAGLLKEGISKLRLESRLLASASSRLKAIGQVYAGEFACPDEAGSFSAQG